VLAILGWEQFFTEFHRLFFANGTWTFSLQDTLIRLFPGQFWVDAGIVIGALVLLISLVTLILTWPTRKRRGLPKKGQAKGGAGGNRQSAEHTAMQDPAMQDPDPAVDAPAPEATSEQPAGIRARFKRAKARKADAAQEAAAGNDGPGDTATDPAQWHDKPSRGHSSTV
jgi:hypothetical protein